MTGPEDDAGLTGKVAIISGGGAEGDGIGNGRAASILLARAGTRVMVADLDLALAQRTVDMIEAEGGSAAAIACDITRESECKRLVQQTVSRFGRLDFLDNNVGIGSRGSVVDEKPEEYRRVMQVNVETMFLLSKYAIPAMIETAKGGAIVNCADEFHPRASHSGAKGGRTKRWSFGRAAIAERSSSSSRVPSASRLAFWLSGRAAFGITMTPS